MNILEDIVVLVPARGGSKGVPRKNMKLLAEKPLLEYTLDLLQAIGLRSRSFVSSDCSEICEFAMEHGFGSVVRSLEAASDSASMESVVLEFLNLIEKDKALSPKLVLLLQPTSPLRKLETLIKLLDTFEKEKERYDAFFSFTESREDLWSCDDSGKAIRLRPDAPRRRQDREPYLIENSAYYLFHKEAFLKHQTFLMPRIYPFIIDVVEGIDINTQDDFDLAENHLKKEIVAYS